MPTFINSFFKKYLLPVIIENGTSNKLYIPFNGLYDFSQTGIIYLNSDLSNNTKGNIKSISLQFTGWTPNYTVNNQTIKISHITRNDFPSPLYPDYRDISNNISDTTIVKNNFNFTVITNSWIKIDLDENFYWNGQDNILISWENRDGE